MARKDCTRSGYRTRRRLVQYGLSALLYPAAIVAAGAPADESVGEPAISTASGTPGESPASMFTYGGFGTLGVTHSDQPLADFTSSSLQGVGAGHSHAWSAAVDSLVAAQVGAQITPQLSAVLQVMSEQNADASFSPHVEWAYVKYKFTPDFSVRAGRTDLGVFLLSDSRNIGFTYTWARPPVELYDLVSATNSDGIDFSYRLGVADGSNTIDASIGHSHYHYPIPNSQATGTSDATEQFSLIDTFQRGWTTLRLNYGQAHLTLPTLEPLFDAFREFGSQGVGVADLYDVNDRILTYYGASAAYEPGDWFLMAELGRVDAHSVLGRGHRLVRKQRPSLREDHALRDLRRDPAQFQYPSSRARTLRATALPCRSRRRIERRARCSTRECRFAKNLIAGCPPRRDEQYRHQTTVGPYGLGSELAWLADQRATWISAGEQPQSDQRHAGFRVLSSQVFRDIRIAIVLWIVTPTINARGITGLPKDSVANVSHIVALDKQQCAVRRSLVALRHNRRARLWRLASDDQTIYLRSLALPRPREFIRCKYAGRGTGRGALRGATLQGLNGPSQSLAAFRGRPLIINVWASWCGPCRAEMASLERLAWQGQQFAIIGISTDDYADRAKNLLKNTNATISHFIDHDLQMENMLGASQLPLTVLVDAGGRVLKKIYGARQWDSAEELRLIAETFHTTPRRP